MIVRQTLKRSTTGAESKVPFAETVELSNVLIPPPHLVRSRSNIASHAACVYSTDQIFAFPVHSTSFPPETFSSMRCYVINCESSSLKQIEAQSTCTESTNKGVNEHSKDVAQTQQQRPESLRVTLAWHASKVHKLGQRYRGTWDCDL